MMTIYHNPRCAKSRQALGIIEEKGKDAVVREYLKNPLSEEELKQLIVKLGMSPKDLIRKGEAVFKENFKGKELSDEEWIRAMVDFPKLIERPIVVEGEKAVIGRPPENVLKLL